MQIIFNNLQQIPLKAIDRRDSLTEFSPGPAPDLLMTSIREIGVVHPIILVKSGDRFKIVCGHRRANACESLHLPKIPALAADSRLDEETMLTLNLTENHAHRTFSDIEKGRVLNKLADANVSADRVIRKYMPLLDLERSRKVYQDFSCIRGLNPSLQKLLHELNVPLRIFFPLTQWDSPSRDAAESLFAVLRPGVNKWRELLELMAETAEIENKPPAEIIHGKEIQSVLNQNDLPGHEKYDRIIQTITPRRYPVLTGLRKKIARTLDQLSLGNQTKIRIQESFETEEIKIEIKGRSQKSLIEEVQRLERAVGSEAMAELTRILRELK